MYLESLLLRSIKPCMQYMCSQTSPHQTATAFLTREVDSPDVGHDPPAALVDGPGGVRAVLVRRVQDDGLLVVAVAQVGGEVRLQVLVLAGLGLAGNASDEHATACGRGGQRSLNAMGCCSLSSSCTLMNQLTM